MSANKHTNKLKLQNYAYEVSDNGVFIHPKETSNVWFQPFTYDNIAHAYYPIPGHGDYPFIEASDIDWRPYKIDGHDVVTSYDIIHSMEVMSSSYWVAGEGVSSIVRVIDQYMGTAAGAYAISEGVLTEASGESSHAEGDRTIAQGKNSHAEGQQSGALKVNSHAEGYGTTGDNSGAHAEGNRTTASGLQTHAEGNATEASGNNSHSEGNNTISSGLNSHAEGSSTIALGLNSHAQGNNTIASGENSHAEGVGADGRGAIGKQSHAEGLRALASGTNSHAEGSISTASGTASHAEGNLTEASGVNSHAEGNGTKSLGSASHAEGVNTYAAGKTSHAEGKQNQAWGENSHAEGFRTYTSGMASHSEGAGTITALAFIDPEDDATIYETNGDVELHENDIIKYGGNFARVVSVDGNDITLSNTLGEITGDIPYAIGKVAYGDYSHAEGFDTKSIGTYSHAEGNGTIAYGEASHAEGFDTKSIGSYSHAEGMSTYVSGNYAHGEGKNTFAIGNYSHAEGMGFAELTDYKLTSSSSTQYIVSDIVNDVPKRNDLLMYNGIIGRVILFNSTSNILRVMPSFGTIESPTQVYKISGVAFDTSAHVEGSQNIAIGGSSHAEGIITLAAGGGSHTEGFGTVVRGNYGHAEGVDTIASGASSHAEGEGSTAGQKSSHAEGNYTHATNLYEHAQGTYNLSTRTDTSLTFGSNGNTLHSIGIGTSDDDRKNAVEVMQNGDMYVIGIGDYDGTNFTTASTLQESLASSTAYAATKVNQIIATGNASYRLLFKYSPNDNPENSYTYYADSIWYNPSLDALTNKGGAYFATTSGAVGIGTATPQKKLDVQGDSMFNGIVNIDSSAMGAKTHINFNRASFNYVNVPTGGTFAVSVNGAGGAKTRLAVDNIAAFPGETNDSIDLGKPNYHWRAAYVNRIRTQSYELMETNSGTRIGFGTFNHNKAAYVNVGNLLVSNAWTDASKVPYDGIYSKGQIKSGVATGTAPFVVSSTTKVANLNADLLDGESTYSIRAYPKNNGDLLYSWKPYLEAGITPPGVPASAGAPVISFNGAPETYCVGPITGRSVGITSDFIPVNAGDSIYGEVWAYREASEDAAVGTIYCGIMKYDKDKKVIGSNNSLNISPGYFVAGGSAVNRDGVWHRWAGSCKLPVTHTPYNGSDGGPIYYIKVYVLVNYASSGTATPTWLGGVNFYRMTPSNDSRYVNVTGDTMTGRLQITYDEDVSAAGNNGALVVGAFSGLNIGIDNNEIMARNNGAASTLNLNVEGGPIAVGGAIQRFYKNASDEPMIALTSNDKDTWLWRINWDTTASSLAVDKKYGFGLKYIGTGSGNDKSLVLYADNQAGTQLKAVEVKQNGVTYTYQNIYALGYVTLGNSTTADRTTVTSVLNVDGNTTIAGYLKANAYVNLGNSTTADRTTVTSVLNVDGNTTIAGYLKANAYVTLGNSTTADRTTVTSVLNIEGDTTIKDGSYLKALGYVTLGNSTTADRTTVASVLNVDGNTTIAGYLKANAYVNLGNSTTADRTTVTSVLNIEGDTTIKDGSYLKALGNVTLGNSTTADTTTVASVLNIEGDTTIKDGSYLKAFGNVTLGNSTTADTTTVASILNIEGNTTIKDGSYLKALGNVTLGNAVSDTTTVASILNIESNTTIKDNAYFKAFGNVTLGNSTTADTTLVNSVLNAQADITAVGYIRTNSKNAYIGTPGDQCHLKYDNSTKCIKFIFD